MCIFSKFTRPSMLVLLPSCANVISFNSNGMNGMTGGCNLPTDILRWCMMVSVEWMTNSGAEKRKHFSWETFSMANFNLNYFSSLTRCAVLCQIALGEVKSAQRQRAVNSALTEKVHDRLTCKLYDFGSDLWALRTRWKVCGTLMEVCPRFELTATQLSLTFPSQWRKMHLNFDTPCS